ncbi:MAG: menaquinone biosynthesis protein [Desulfobulbaceae bacterium]|nr:menaquinone biosynthesis protein [Desulfobulbaceae bacterium]
MNTPANTPARIGMVNYINTAPLYEIWKEKSLPDNWLVVEGRPRQLNELLLAGSIDMGFVSSFAYALHPERYQIFAGLSISATGPVGSVFLFSHLPVAELDGKELMLTQQSDTSIRLVQIILEEFYRIKPVYTSGPVYGPESAAGNAAAVLAIGDDALRISREKAYPVQLDLGDAWMRQTGLPFVFSVCVVREDFIKTQPEEARRIREMMLACRHEGGERMAEICTRVSRRIPMDHAACTRYLHAIEHDLTPVKIRALETYFSYLVARGEVPATALPVKIFS